ncbi:cation efflux protein/ zinc transporter, putative [Entamoeba invadens IP1]|uniref:Cation efflux protein/ zinc transporter, putative n=1 Tax=Entamoeba invadens IP1 TaxID=370355 RepID=A0A0A1U528_ENTIV|nr:cation efflux protein/ zinc transporter, putative [Entamoeba invadens IP1]ELP87977.1 cation efflux protein/ zinc transporter, putative [Entamoeba invadens IP1]|eukprot:XP_004254748.1 cation efflux protein/ zinc transporter, putative [Entamoeba invadens IP1]
MTESKEKNMTKEEKIGEIEMKDEKKESAFYEIGHDSWKLYKEKFNVGATNKNKKLRKFYKEQSRFVDNLFEEPVDEKDDIGGWPTKIAIYGSFAINLCLCVTKIVAAVFSGSLTVIASALDSCLDIVSGAVVFITALLMKKPNPSKYPIGKKRMEPLGIIVFATAMFTATIQLLTSAGQTLLAGSSEFEMSIFPICVIGATIFLKCCLFLYCRTVNNPAAGALADDHRNDILTNTFGMCMSIVGYYYFWWLDAVGGIVLSFYIMLNWFMTLLEYLSIMSGKAAPQEFISQIILTCWNHDPRIKAIDTVRAFHLSMGYMVEVDIVLNENMTLAEAHDIGETLQTKIEKHPNVDRAFVHLDYNDDHDVFNEHEQD